MRVYVYDSMYVYLYVNKDKYEEFMKFGLVLRLCLVRGICMFFFYGFYVKLILIFVFIDLVSIVGKILKNNIECYNEVLWDLNLSVSRYNVNYIL